MINKHAFTPSFRANGIGNSENLIVKSENLGARVPVTLFRAPPIVRGAPPGRRESREEDEVPDDLTDDGNQMSYGSELKEA